MQIRALRLSDEHHDDLTQTLESDYRVQPLLNIVWPHTSEIAKEQASYFPDSRLARNSEGLLVDSDNRVLIPWQCRSLRLRLCVIAHAASRSGHLGYPATLQLLKERVYWVDMAEDLRAICSSCLYCLPMRKGYRIPRPLGEACHGISLTF